MKDCNYVVNRDDVYVGIVSSTKKEKIKLYPNGIYCNLPFLNEEQIRRSFDARRYLLERKSYLCYGNICFPFEDEYTRTMLFIIDEEKKANDLLYDSPNYPIFNISKDEESNNALISLKNDVYQLKTLLEYFNYPEKLTYDHVAQIKDFFFRDFILDNCELFGYYETSSYETGVERIDSTGKHRTFNIKKEDSILPNCYFLHLSDLRWRIKDTFIPLEIEGPIKSLKSK